MISLEKIFLHKRVIFFFLTAVLAGSAALFLVNISGQEHIPENNTDAEEEKEEEYPLFTGTPFSSPNTDATATFSLYYSEEKGPREIHAENAEKILPIASISKLMTAFVVYQSYEMEDAVRVSEKDVITRTEFRDYRAWEETKVEEMIHQIIIESNNSAAFAMGLISDRYLSSNDDSVSAFVNKMNSAAKQMGLSDTTFINPSGLDVESHYNASTAREVALMSLHILLHEPEIFTISAMPSYRLYSPDEGVHYTSISTNVFLHNKEHAWQENIIGGKTGYTRFANGCLVLVLQEPESEGYIINVILGAEDRFAEMKKLTEYVYQNYTF